ncbi:hypothetical protein ACU8MB_16185 [Rhizobium leguminosarum]
MNLYEYESSHFVRYQRFAEVVRDILERAIAAAGNLPPPQSIQARAKIGVAARVAKIVHPELDLSDRVQKLTVRLTYSVPGTAVDLATEAGANLTRGDYCAVVEAGLGVNNQGAADADILRVLGDDDENLATVRKAARLTAERQSKPAGAPLPAIPEFVA